MPDDGLPISKQLSALMSLQPAEVYRGQAAELLKETLINLSKKFNSLLTISSTGIDELKEYYTSLRNEIQLATREAIEQLNDITMSS